MGKPSRQKKSLQALLSIMEKAWLREISNQVIFRVFWYPMWKIKNGSTVSAQ